MPAQVEVVFACEVGPSPPTGSTGAGRLRSSRRELLGLLRAAQWGLRRSVETYCSSSKSAKIVRRRVEICNRHDAVTLVIHQPARLVDRRRAAPASHQLDGA
jgi:hypothetical protein